VPLPPTIAVLSRWYPENYGDPFQPLRVIGGIVPGHRSGRQNLLIGSAVHLLLSAVLGSLFTLGADRLAGRSRAGRAAAGAALGTAQWLLTYYGVLIRVYPEQVDADPLWVAGSSHAGFGALIGLLT